MPILNCFYCYLQFIEKAQQNKDSHNTTLLSLHICSSRFQTLLKLFIKKNFLSYPVGCSNQLFIGKDATTCHKIEHKSHHGKCRSKTYMERGAIAAKRGSEEEGGTPHHL